MISYRLKAKEFEYFVLLFMGDMDGNEIKKLPKPIDLENAALGGAHDE